MGEDRIPEYLVGLYPFLKDVPYDIWARFWPFPALPPETTGSLPWAVEHFAFINKEPLGSELKELKWSNLIMEYYHLGLLSEEEKDRYSSWEFR